MGTLITAIEDIRDKLIDDGVFQPDVIFITAEPDRTPKESPSTLYGTISPTNFRVRTGSQKGGGKVTFHKDGNVVINIYSQLLVDPSHTDTNLLTDTTLGLLAKAAEIQASLEQYFPSSLRIPLKFLEEGSTTKQPNGLWSSWRCVFEVSLERDLS